MFKFLWTLRKLNSKNKPTKLNGIESLDSLDRAEVVDSVRLELLVRLLKDSHTDVRKAAAQSISRGGEASVELTALIYEIPQARAGRSIPAVAAK
jgi:hypothetical protein